MPPQHDRPFTPLPCRLHSTPAIPQLQFSQAWMCQWTFVSFMGRTTCGLKALLPNLPYHRSLLLYRTTACQHAYPTPNAPPTAFGPRFKPYLRVPTDAPPTVYGRTSDDGTRTCCAALTDTTRTHVTLRSMPLRHTRGQRRERHTALADCQLMRRWAPSILFPFTPANPHAAAYC